MTEPNCAGLSFEEMAEDPAAMCKGCPLFNRCQLSALEPVNISEILEAVGGDRELSDDVVYQSGVVKAGVLLETVDRPDPELVKQLREQYPQYAGNCKRCHRPTYRSSGDNTPATWSLREQQGVCVPCSEYTANRNSACDCCGRVFGSPAGRGVVREESPGKCEACMRNRRTKKPLTLQALRTIACQGCKQWRQENGPRATTV